MTEGPAVMRQPDGPPRPETGAIESGPGGAYHGQPTHRLRSAHLWVDVLAAAGPRIIRVGLAGSPENLLAETPDLGWETPTGRYELFGGHRLWFAPEDPERVAIPDTDGLILELLPSGVRLTGVPEPHGGLVRSITVTLDPSSAAIELRHELANTGARPIELAPWAITQLPLGGVVLMPQPAASVAHSVQPNRKLVLWPYTSWEDRRVELHDGLMLVRAVAGPDVKLGYFNEAGWVAYLRGASIIVRRFEPALGRSHPDLGCNVETYCGDRFLELELLGPLAEIAPGGVAVQSERWEVATVGPRADGCGPSTSAADVLDVLARLGSIEALAFAASNVAGMPAPRLPASPNPAPLDGMG